MDFRIGKIWEALSKRAENNPEDWLILVTTDHGRDPLGGYHHGEQSDRERTIWIATNSDKLNPHFYNSPGIVDILPTICSHMQIDIPDNISAKIDGVSFLEVSSPK